MQQSDVHQVQPVGILAVVDEIQNPCGIVVVGEGKLDENGIDILVAVAFVNHHHQFALRCGFRQEVQHAVHA